jgi:hypothetical protein
MSHLKSLPTFIAPQHLSKLQNIFLTFYLHNSITMTPPACKINRKRVGILERILLSYERPRHDTNVIITEADAEKCLICYGDFAAHTCTPSKATDACDPVRLKPCGHVIGKTCFDVWLASSRWAVPWCLQCTAALNMDYEKDSALVRVSRKVCRSKVLRFLERAVKISLEIGVFLTILTVLGMFIVSMEMFDVAACVCEGSRKGRGRKLWKKVLGRAG